MTNMTATESNAIRDMAAASVEPLSPPAFRAADGVPYIALPPGFTVNDLERLYPSPARSKGTTEVFAADSFIALVNVLKSDATRLYCRATPTPSFTAVLNDDMDGRPGWRDWRAVYNCPLSVEWAAWNGANGKAKNQVDFATFIEDNAPDIASPPAANMIEISRTLEAKKAVSFASGIRLDNGQTQFTYEEDIKGTAGKGRLEIPQSFTIGIPVLVGGPRYAVTAKLRYRISDKGALTLWFDLERPHKVLEDAINEVKAFIVQGTELPVFNGDAKGLA